MVNINCSARRHVAPQTARYINLAYCYEFTIKYREENVFITPVHTINLLTQTYYVIVCSGLCAVVSIAVFFASLEYSGWSGASGSVLPRYRNDKNY